MTVKEDETAEIRFLGDHSAEHVRLSELKPFVGFFDQMWIAESSNADQSKWHKSSMDGIDHEHLFERVEAYEERLQASRIAREQNLALKMRWMEAGRPFLFARVGKCIEVCWPIDKVWYPVVILAHPHTDSVGNKVALRYMDDNVEETIALHEHEYRLVDAADNFDDPDDAKQKEESNDSNASDAADAADRIF